MTSCSVATLAPADEDNKRLTLQRVLVVSCRTGTDKPYQSGGMVQQGRDTQLFSVRSGPQHLQAMAWSPFQQRRARSWFG